MSLPKSLTTVTTFSKLLALWLYLFLPFAGFYLGMVYQKELVTDSFYNPSNQVFCTQDAKMCPDGSYVSRQGPNCEFTPCEKMEP